MSSLQAEEGFRMKKFEAPNQGFDQRSWSIEVGFGEEEVKELNSLEDLLPWSVEELGSIEAWSQTVNPSLTEV